MTKEDVWVSVVSYLRQNVSLSQYKLGSPSVHGKVRVESGDGGAHLESLNGVNVERVSKVRHTASNLTNHSPTSWFPVRSSTSPADQSDSLVSLSSLLTRRRATFQ